MPDREDDEVERKPADQHVRHTPRRFKLVRTEDESGVSGTGVVAYGVAYPDGAVHMQWRNASNEALDTDSNGCAFKPAPDGVTATLEIHGHDGRTHLQWIDDERVCPYCGESVEGYGASELESVRITDSRGRETRQEAHVFCATVAAVNPPYTGYCGECGAKHGVEDDTMAATTCMCAGTIYPVDALDTVEVTVNGDLVEFPTMVPPKPSKLLEAAGYDPREYVLSREGGEGECSEPLVVDEGDAFTAWTRGGATDG